MIENGASLDCEDAEGNNLLVQAIKGKNFPFIDFLIKNYPHLLRGSCENSINPKELVISLREKLLTFDNPHIHKDDNNFLTDILSLIQNAERWMDRGPIITLYSSIKMSFMDRNCNYAQAARVRKNEALIVLSNRRFIRHFVSFLSR